MSLLKYSLQLSFWQDVAPPSGEDTNDVAGFKIWT